MKNRSNNDAIAMKFISTRKRLLHRLTALAVVMMLMATSFLSGVSADAGDLDPSFAFDGIAITDFGPNTTAKAVAIQADGKTLAAGRTWDPPIDFVLARYNLDGSLDQSFGTGGMVLTDFGGSDFAYSMAIRSDGRIILAGTTRQDGETNNIALARYKVDGSLDPAFGSDGKVIFDLVARIYVEDVALQADGKIVVVGILFNDFSLPAHDFFVARFTASGDVDTSFGGGEGFVTTNFSYRAWAEAVVVQSDGKIVVAGHSSDESGNSINQYNFDFCLARYNADGSLDTLFGSGGRVVTEDFGGGYTADLLLQPDGKLVLAGGSASGTDSQSNFAVALIRYNVDGSLDPSFGGSGFTSINLNSTDDDGASAAALQPDGKIVAGGNSYPKNSALVRFNSDGSLDNTFGIGGIVITDIDYIDGCTGIAIRGDRRIVTSNYTQHSSSPQYLTLRSRAISTARGRRQPTSPCRSRTRPTPSALTARSPTPSPSPTTRCITRLRTSR